MSQQESLEAWMATHSQACKTIENRMREEVDAALRQAYFEAGDAVRRALEAAHERQSTEMQRTFENLEETLREAGISHYNSSRRSLQDKDLEITHLREEYEAKLKAKDEEIAALKESVNDLRGSCRDKDAIITATMETNKRQLEEQAKLVEAEEEAMRLSMTEQKKDAEQRLQNKTTKLEQQLRQTDQKIELERAEHQKLLEKVEECYETIEDLRETADKLSNDKKQLVEAQSKLLATAARMESNEISSVLYKLSLETSRIPFSRFLAAEGWSFFVQVLNAIVQEGNTINMRNFVENVKDSKFYCFLSVCSLKEFPKDLVKGICDAHNDKCPKIMVVVDKSHRRIVYFER
ncbi:hypothetical protein FPANT_10293 [Fusarium pseudoanthophilum]|uniref:Uncharacterized protein n=1 Tax=Fusarium pseudoanthophilum TaxID=48495 RepID=A0A8H5NVW5_9HYPO|nr:hypothetical protein FPANT_10293 [Fusarium pseudoanthophilum]